ncbi:PSD1 and planctomycete cytochrome C domain-containing protein [Rubinisphaera margarita]|uniref:PSD1 and planctomycete cytochrome C domain-containing protein n=1 Tax=Rubinisphaera margarita TaxID=2909586 RepID=UPI001EE81DB5|nr:PSD1 and planctomycete cytochrome C domain-containing protein [Rubinisphaera margarita]MCG6158133.1 PSD1 and planctomycete cytochrome C domain-containing protein [Rubinisphaera margarita]
MKRYAIGIAQLFALGIALLSHAMEPAVAEGTKTPSPEELKFFESRIRPVLVKHCYDCHSLETETAEGGLRVDDRAAIRAGGGRGPAVIPNRPDASVLLTAMSHADSDLKMPPREDRLSDDVLHDFRTWITMGAPDPREPESESSPPAELVWSKAARHWSYQPLIRANVPDVEDADWPRDPIDHFIGRAQLEQDLTPSPDAEPGQFLRRLTFDLIGLPPSPEDLERFQEDWHTRGADVAIEREVDRLLASPRFGEHWGRHWLDVARFGESSGKEANISFPFAWRYRDYVIDSVNDDLPVDRFLIEQIAGDLLPYETEKERARLLVATGFLAVGTKNLSERNEKQFQADLVDEQIDSLTRAVMASSVACARCHDHKFDPFAMKDYYALAGIFSSTETYFGTHVSPASQQGGDLIRLPRVEDEVILHPSVPEKKAKQLQQQLVELQAEKAEMDAAMRAAFSGRKPEKTFTLQQALGNIWRTGAVKGQLAKIDDQGQAIPVAMGALDRDIIIDAPLLARGEIDRPGEPVPRGFPRVIAIENSPEIPENTSGRMQLAKWLTDPSQPLTTRVFVNRVWHHIFGTGIVRTVDDFGTTGEAPSHPELLDLLALDFMDDGWSLKRLVRRLVLTRTYRQSSHFRETNFLKDPDNRRLWRIAKRRLPAEAIRDAMLVASGELETSRPQGSLVGTTILDRPISLIGLDKRLPKDLDGSVHRSVYLPVIRDRLPDVLDLFDFAEPSLVTGQRETTNVPLQALYLMNSDFVTERSRAFAARLSKQSDSPKEIVRQAFLLCFSREPDQEELERALVYLSPRSQGSLRPEDDRLLETFCQALFSTAEFRNID